MATGSLTVKRGKYYAIISTYTVEGTKKKRKQKWINLGIPEKGGKKAAKRKLKEILISYKDDLKPKEKLIPFEYDQKSNEIIITSEDDPKSKEAPIPSEAGQKMKYITLLDVVSGYIRDSKDRLAPTTYNSYRYNLDSHIEPYFSKLPNQDLDSLTARDINLYYNSLRRKGLGESSISKQHQILAAAFNEAMNNELISTNVMKRVKHPTEDYHEVEFYDIDQLRVLLTAAKNSPIYTEILLAVFLGLRRGEALGLKWDKINLDKKTVKIHRNVTPARDDTGKETIFIREKMKTKKSVRNLILPESLAQYLRNLKLEQENRKETLGDSYSTDFDGFVCVDRFGKLHNPNYVSKTFKKILRENNLPHIRFHDLRHSCATMLLSLGFSMKAVQEHLGHTQYTTTANTYAHVYDKTKIEIADKTGSVLHIA